MLITLAVLFSSSPGWVADTAFVNGKFLTPSGDAEVLVTHRNRIIYIGSAAGAPPARETVNLAAKRVLPGFYDSHAHFLGGGLQLARVELKDATDGSEFGKRIAAFDAQLPRDRWMLGGNWDHDRAFGGVLPTAKLLDQYANNRPVFLRRYDGHMALANTAALKLAGITPETPDPAGGVIYRLDDGKTPSGVLKDNAMKLVESIIPDPSNEEITEAVRAALTEAACYGVTSIQDMEGSTPAVRQKLLRILQTLDRQHELTCRIDLRWPIALHKELIQTGIEADFGTDYLRIGGVKGYMDGSLGSSTAKMFDPFVNEPTNTGVFVTEPDAMRSLIRSADAAGLSVAVHAIGDQANAVLLDLFADTRTVNGERKNRQLRVEHAQHLRPRDFVRFKELDVYASMQPFHIADDGRWAAGRIGEARCESSYAFRSLLNSGATLAFGSDWPVAPLDPLPGLAAAVNRHTLDGDYPGGWHPQERITAAEAIKAYTAGSAKAAGQFSDRGTLEVGKFADFVVLNADPVSVKPGDTFDWPSLKVELTVVGGKVVFKR